MPKDEVFSRSTAIYTYDLSKLDNVTKVRFVYLLKGRKKGHGLIDELNGKFLVPGCFLIDISKTEKIESIFRQWSVSFKKEEVLMK